MSVVVNGIIDKIVKKLVLKKIPLLLASQEAWWMLEALTQMSRAKLLCEKELVLSSKDQKILDEWIVLRTEKHMPLQYILGSVPFCDLDITVKSPILIPRPETEEMVTWLIDIIKQEKVGSLKILDMCTGSGCIGLALAHNFPKSQVVGVDINPMAIELASENKKINSIVNAKFILSNLYDKLKSDQFDIIITNPPYLSHTEYDEVSDSVKKWEDEKALVAADNGMYFYHHIIKSAKKHLSGKFFGSVREKIPVIVCEFGPSQHGSLESIFIDSGFLDVRFFRDLQGELRWAAAYI